MGCWQSLFPRGLWIHDAYWFEGWPPLAIVCLSARSCHTGLSTWPLPFSNIARERKCLEQVRQSDCLISGNAILVLTSHHLIFYYLEASYRSSSYSRGGDYTRAWTSRAEIMGGQISFWPHQKECHLKDLIHTLTW